MHGFATFLVDASVVFFFLGLAGSSIVILITFFEDFHELFGPDESTPDPVRPAPSSSEAGSTR